MPISIAENRDCMDAMKEFPDQFFDLAVVDPPYGDAGGEFKRKDKSRFGGQFDRYRSHSVNVERERAEHRTAVHKLGNAGKWSDKNRGNVGGEVLKKIISWDIAPGQEYFEELFRVSRNQIIWGGNYFSLPPSRCFLIWRKTNVPEDFSMAMAEYAWTSFNDNAKIFEFSAVGQKGRFHPTQKPIELYAWIFSKYAESGMKILDTHLGSGSSRIAAYNANIDFWGYEIDKEYFNLQEKRFQKAVTQTSLFIESNEDLLKQYEIEL